MIFFFIFSLLSDFNFLTTFSGIDLFMSPRRRVEGHIHLSLSVRLSVRPFVRSSVCPPVRSYICPLVHSSVRSSIRLSVRLSVCPFVRLSVRPFVRPSLCPSVRLSVQIQIHGLLYYLLLQFQSYSFNILKDVYRHNGGVHVHRI